MSPTTSPLGDERPAHLVLDGGALTAAEVARAARDPRVRLTVSEAARQRVRASRRQIEQIVERYKSAYEAFEDGSSEERPVQDYGITTGFGEFKDVPVSPKDLEELQRNLLRSHAVGLGENSDADDPANYFPPEVVRATLIIRINAFLKGHSGVRESLVDTLLAMVHCGVVPLVPIRGSLGSSGDLCPLAHLFNVLLGEGRYYRVTGLHDMRFRVRELSPASSLADDLEPELEAGPAVPSYKEGLALSNGATVSTALLALAVVDAQNLADSADTVAALTLEAACGCARAFDPQVHAARGQRGQITSAGNIRLLVEGSRLVDSAGAVQDAYSLRCAPVVHGASRDAIEHVREIAEREINAATDNPLFFPQSLDPQSSGQEAWDYRFADNWPAEYDGRQRSSFSAGNFHGQPIALAADYLTIAVSELANISERRCQLLLDHHHNRNLPANLVAHRGLNSGLMLVQYGAASLVCENKVLAHPASVDSIPTAANIEDHVAVATTAARKARTVVSNVSAVLAMELVVAAQAVDWRAGVGYPPVRRSPDDPGPVAADAGPSALDDEAERFVKGPVAVRRPAICEQLGHGTAKAYLAARRVVAPLDKDRVLADDLLSARRLVEDGQLSAVVHKLHEIHGDEIHGDKA